MKIVLWVIRADEQVRLSGQLTSSDGNKAVDEEESLPHLYPITPARDTYFTSSRAQLI